MDKIYFLSSEEAFKQFAINPRPFLLPTMPTSPIKFFVIGHPLAGKTLFSEELAAYLGAHVQLDSLLSIPNSTKPRSHCVLFCSCTGH